MTDPRHAKTLGEAAENRDGTLNGAAALSWLSEALHPGKGVPQEEVKRMWADAKARQAAKKA